MRFDLQSPKQSIEKRISKMATKNYCAKNETNGETFTTTLPQINLKASNMAREWRIWLTQFNIFVRGSNLENASDRRKVGFLLHHLGSDALDVFYSFNKDIGTVKYDELVSEFDSYFIPTKENAKSLLPIDEAEPTINYISKTDYKMKQANKQNKCTKCGQRHRNKCPATGKKCRYCGKSGHFEKMCFLKKKYMKHVHTIEGEYDTEEQEDNLFIGALSRNTTTASEWNIEDSQELETFDVFEEVEVDNNFIEENPAKRPRKVTKELKTVPEIGNSNEFTTFGESISYQLQKLPEEDAYSLMAEMQNLITKRKLKNLRIARSYSTYSNEST